MPEPAPKPELLRSLGRLARGLSALFWGLPLALIICVQTAKTEWLRSLSVIPPLVATGLLVYGLWLLGGFQKQERVWQNALDRALILGLINFGLSPFLYWWNRVPAKPFFFFMVLLLAFSGLMFLSALNFVLDRLGAMLPDEALRTETRQFTVLNRNLILVTVLLALSYFVANQFESLPLWLATILSIIDRSSFWFLIPLVLLPLAMTMALLWKTKEVILDSVFGAER
jgi:hypothetical protein